MAGISVPSRMYNVMSAGMPIIAIADPGSELARVVIEEDIGWTVTPGDTDAFLEAVLAARDDLRSRLAKGKRARQAAVSRYSFGKVSQAFVKLFEEDLH
jgi:glycosyltransferase involved in cell wall biosynthesis